MSRPRAPAVYLSIYLSILIYLSLHPGFRYTLRGSGDFAILNRPTVRDPLNEPISWPPPTKYI